MCFICAKMLWCLIMCAVNGDKLGQEDRALLVHLVPRRLAGRIANASSDIPPEVARLLWTWWRGFERVYEKRGREGLLQERDALQRRYNEVMAKSWHPSQQYHQNY